MKVSEQLAIMKAYTNKIPIEVKHRLSTNKWKDLIYTNDYYFNFYEYEYRIKEETEYRPYKTIEEAFNEAKKHGCWIKHKDKNKECLLCIKLIELTKEKGIYLGYSLYSKDVLEKYVWADDNSPCGIKTQ